MVTQVLIAFSDTGGGHRSAALNLQAALAASGRAIDVRLVDPYAESRRWPFHRLSAAYPVVVNRAAWLWRAGFRLTNRRWVAACAQRLAWPVLRRRFRQLRAESTPSVIVSTHPLLTAPLRRVFRETPIAVVVTDLVSGHVTWYEPQADLVVTPTLAARDRALAQGVAADRVREMGLPISPTCVAQLHDARTLRAELGWHLDRPTVLLVGGGDGVGPLEAIATAIDQAGLPLDLAIVTGRNALMAERLRARAWHGTVHIYGFVPGLGPMLRAAAALVTKAGPGTICEAFAAGCPMVLYAAIPGQETGNVDLVCASGAGVWAPRADVVVRALSGWFGDSADTGARDRAAAAALTAARPSAAAEIATEILALADGATAPHDQRDSTSSTSPFFPGTVMVAPGCQLPAS